MLILYPTLATVLAYLIGSLSFAVIVSKVMGLKDPRTFGSKNPGATNVLRSGSKAAAIVTLLLDAFKGWLPVVLVGVALRVVWRKKAFTPQKSGCSSPLLNGWSWHWVHCVWMPRNRRVTRDVMGTASWLPSAARSPAGIGSPRWTAVKLTAPFLFPTPVAVSS